MSRTVMVVAAHPDDEVLGCGGTMARHAAEGDRVVCVILGEGATSRHATREEGLDEEAGTLRELLGSAACAAEILGTARLETFGFPDNRFDDVPVLDLIKALEPIFDEEQPEVVYAHHAGDVNVDHVAVHTAVLALCRQLPATALRELCFFEVPSSTEWQTPAVARPFVPNWFVDISGTVDRKIAAMEAYTEEIRPFPHPRSSEALRALATWRGASVGVAAAEAFVLGRRFG